MLEELSIRGLGVIEDATVPLSSGLTVLTGETGAGKTMVLTALGLLLGQKADAAKVREGDERTSVEAVFGGLPADAVARIDEAGGEVEDGTVVVARVVTPQRSRALIGGRTVPAGVLADVGARLVAIHGQDDQVHLRRPSAQRDAVDRYAGQSHLDRVARHRAGWAELRELRSRLQALTADAARAADRVAWVVRGVSAVEGLAPLPGEDESLRAFIDRAQNVEDLRTAAATAASALSGDTATTEYDASVAALLATARKALAAPSVDDPTLAALGAELDGLATGVDAVAHELAVYLDQLDADPDELERALDRRGALRDARRTWCDADPSAPTDLATVTDHADALLVWLDAARAERDRGDADEQLAQLRTQLDTAEQQLTVLARSIRKGRRAAATQLQQRVTAEFDELGMAGAALVVTVDDAEPDAFGADAVTFALQARPESPPVPIDKGASGGEMSRIMLGLEVVLAASDPVGTFVFDEVDAGVGGRAATEVGARLAMLARTAQVIVVTHLPQVAAFADHHIVVERSTGADVVASDVRELDDQARVVELARMLSGMADSELGRAHADELLSAAHVRRGTLTP
jgi:DNA repair protein RecN (Recombination protein N)